MIFHELADIAQTARAFGKMTDCTLRLETGSFMFTYLALAKTKEVSKN